MPEKHSPPTREAKLRLALRLERQYTNTVAKADPLQQSAEQVLAQVQHLRRIVDRRQLCHMRGWHKADRTLAVRQAAQLRELQYLLSSLDRTTASAPRSVVAASLIYRDLLAVEAEFDDLTIADDLSSVSVVTDPITLEGIVLGRFRLELDLGRLCRGRSGGDCLHAEALDPNPAACNDEVTHPHVQGGQVCLGEGAILFSTALAEGRLYDAFVVVNQVLHTYNDASPYMALDRWNGRVCDECDDVIRQDDTYSCEACGNTLCPGCEHRCPDCDYSYCRSCLMARDDELLCSSCYDERVAEYQEEQDEDDASDPELQPLTLEEPVHEQATTPG